MDNKGVLRKRIMLDFDDTMVASKFPLIGPEIPGALESIIILQENHDIILNTMRADLANGTLEMAINYLVSNGVILSGTYKKKQLPHTWVGFRMDDPGLIFQIFIDDIAPGIPLMNCYGQKCVDWSSVMEDLVKIGII